MSLFTQEVLKNRRSLLSTQWNPYLQDGDCVLVASGEPVGKPGGLDQTYPFLPHPSYLWLTGLRRPFGVVLYSLKTGWVDFVRYVTDEEKIWEGATSEVNQYGQDLKSFSGFFESQKFKRVIVLGQPSLQYQVFDLRQSLTASAQEKASYSELFEQMKFLMDSTRRVKDESEIALVQNAARIALKGYQRIQQFLRPGVSEREIQIEYEAEIFRHGAHQVPYETIVGSGRNSAVLHAIPTAKIVKSGELVLIDAGVDLSDYCVDITRVFAADGKMTNQQSEFYAMVLASQKAALKKAQPGTNWSDVHREAARIIGEGLQHFKILKGDLGSAFETGAISVFFPHGVGHLVGLRVRDTGCEENKNPKKYGGVSLRVDMKIQENHLLTFEPGCYFIEALIQDSQIRERHKDFINWSEVEKWKDFGGVRLEDDVVISSKGQRNLTELVPK